MFDWNDSRSIVTCFFGNTDAILLSMTRCWRFDMPYREAKRFCERSALDVAELYSRLLKRAATFYPTSFLFCGPNFKGLLIKGVWRFHHIYALPRHEKTIGHHACRSFFSRGVLIEGSAP